MSLQNFILALQNTHHYASVDVAGDIDIDDEDDEDEGADLSLSAEEINKQLTSPEMVKIIAELPFLSPQKIIRLMEHADLSDEQAADIFNVSMLEIFRIRCKFYADDNWNMANYGMCVKLYKRSVSKKRSSSSISKTGKPVQGTKIKDALMAVTDIPVDVEILSAKFDVSVHVLKQFNRFLKPEYVPIGKTIKKQTINGKCFLRLVNV